MTQVYPPQVAPNAWREAHLIGGHAATIFAGQLAVMGFGVVDTVVAGRFSKEALAALSVGASIYISVYVSLLGVVQALLPIYAERRGAGRLQAVGAAARQALYLSFALIVVGTGLLVFPGSLLRWAQVPPALVPDVQSYLWILAAAFAPALWFRMYANLSQALSKPLLVTAIQFVGLAIKVPLSIMLTFGWGMVPAMGVVGCAWATLAVNLIMLLCALLIMRRSADFQAIGFWQRPEKPDWRQLRSFARLGVPSGAATMIEVTSFTLMALFIARQGATAAASHQIASNVTALLYMLPLSMGLSASARTSWHLGAGNPRGAQSALFASYVLLAIISIALIAIIFVANQSISKLYSNDTSVSILAASLLLWVAVFHLMDALQALAGFLLRCYRVAVLPVLVYALCLWGVGLGGGYVLSYQGLQLGSWHWPAMQSPVAFWAAGALANALVALVLGALLVMHSRSRFQAPT